MRFVDLAPPHPPNTHWLRSQEEIARRVDRLDSKPVVEALLCQLEAAFAKNVEMPAVEDLARLPDIPPELRPDDSDDGWKNETEYSVFLRLLNYAFGEFLAKKPEDFSRFTKVVEYEREVEFLHVASRFTEAGPRIEKWVQMLLGGTVDIKASGDEHDSLAFADHVRDWKQERQRAVPTWRSGNILDFGIRDWLLAATCLYALDSIAWLQLIDSQAIPEAAETLIQQEQLDESPETLLSLIREADRAFDFSGQRTQSVAVYFMLRKAKALVEHHLDDRFRHGMTQQESSDAVEAQREPLTDLAVTLRSRPDGQVLVAELSAHYLQASDSSSGQNWRGDSHTRLGWLFGGILADQLGTPEDALEIARQRKAGRKDGESWGLWLTVATRLHSDTVVDTTNNADGSRSLLRPWLKDLMVAGTKNLLREYTELSPWTLELLGRTVASADSPSDELKALWRALAVQRQEHLASRYEKDTWHISKALSRIGFMTSRLLLPSAEDEAVSVWNESMKIAISCWLASWQTNSICEIAYGLAHLSAGAMKIPEEPKNTLAYFVGEPELLLVAAMALLVNGYPPRHLIHDTAASGIDVVMYFELSAKGERTPAFDKYLSLLKAEQSVAHGAQLTESAPT